ncbi:YciI family protein [Marinifilum fragile]|uniref:YciI family protein n=1 Tax=Marinifilum fragile TaxID=570161 RepID=UPI002AA67E70|nr:YciI family protein [Marinifilum fragile]
MKLFKYGLFIAMGMLLSCRFNPSNENKIKKGYNAELATKLKADQYGMSKYVMAFLKRGPVRNQDSITAANLQKAHLENIERLAEEGKLVLAGPFFDDGEIRGIYIFDVETIEEAQTLTQTDPAIKAGRLVMELHPWYGSAALKQINEFHKTLQKQNVSEQ